MAPQKSPEERISTLEAHMDTTRESVHEIKDDIKALPKLVRRQMMLALRRQRREIQADTSEAIRQCREAQKLGKEPPKPDAPWDLSWIKPVLVGLAVVGSLVGGAVAALRGQPLVPVSLSAPAVPSTSTGGGR